MSYASYKLRATVIALFLILMSMGLSHVTIAEQIEPPAIAAFNHARATFAANKYAEAAQEYQAIRLKFPGGSADMLSSYTLALIATYQRDFATAAHEIQTFRTRFPNSDLNFDVTYLEAAIEYSQGHYDKAYAIVTGFDLAKHRPADPAKIQSLYELAAGSAAALGNHPVAVAIVAFQLGLGPDTSTKGALFQKLDGYLGKIASRQALEGLVKQIQDPAVAAKIRARIAALTGSPVAAPMDPNALASLKQAQVLITAAKFDEAAVLFQQVRDQYRGSVADESASYGLAVTHIYRKDYQSAITELQSFLSRFPNSPQAFEAGYLWAAVEMEMRQYDQVYRIVAGFDFVKIPRQSPQRVQAFYELGSQAAAQLGNYPLAVSVSTFERQLIDDPTAKLNILKRIEEYLTHVDKHEALDSLISQTKDPGVLDRIKARLKLLEADERALASHDEEKLQTKGSDLTLGLYYIFPELNFQQAIASHYVLSVQSLLLNYPTSGTPALSGIGGILTLNYYPEQRFSGLWVQGGVGLFSMHSSTGGTTNSLSSPVVMASVGWRWYWPSGTNLGFGAGANYLLKNEPSGTGDQYSSLLPALILDVGFGF